MGKAIVSKPTLEGSLPPLARHTPKIVELKSALDRIKARRKDLNLSLKKFSESWGVPVEKIHQYEEGIERIPTKQFYKMAQILKVKPSYFFRGVAKEKMNDPNIAVLLKAYSKITHVHLRKNLLKLIESLLEDEMIFYLKSKPATDSKVRKIHEPSD